MIAEIVGTTRPAGLGQGYLTPTTTFRRRIACARVRSRRGGRALYLGLYLGAAWAVSAGEPVFLARGVLAAIRRRGRRRVATWSPARHCWWCSVRLIYRTSLRPALRPQPAAGPGQWPRSADRLAILRRLQFRPSLARLRDVLVLMLTALAAPVGHRDLGASAYYGLGGGDPSTFFRQWGTWWRQNALGIMVAAPLLLGWTAPPSPRLRAARCVESVSGLARIWVFFAFVVQGARRRPIWAWGCPIWRSGGALYGAVQYGPRGAATASAVIAISRCSWQYHR